MDNEAYSDKKVLVDESAMDPPPQYEDQYAPYGYPSTTSTVIVTQPGMVVAAVGPPEPKPTGEIVGCIVLSWCVICFLCWPLGCAAFIVSLVGASAHNAAEAKKHLHTAAILNILGIVIGIPITTLFILYKMGIIWNSDANAGSNNYNY